MTSEWNIMGYGIEKRLQTPFMYWRITAR